MPELPELELIRSVLSRHVLGRTVQSVQVDPARQVVLRCPPRDFQRDLVDGTIASIERRGKFLLFAFAERPEALVINPMLGGRFALCSRVAPPLPATCFVLQLSGALDMRFLDATLMARVYVTADPVTDIPAFADLGPDALDLSITYGAFADRLRKRRGELKNVLRNQSFLAGIGNAYSDEILFEARLRPLRRSGTLTDDERRALYDAVRSVLSKSVTIVREQYEAGKHPLHKQDRSFMRIHGKGKSVCPRCGHRVSVVHAGGEATYFCRGCQK